METTQFTELLVVFKQIQMDLSIIMIALAVIAGSSIMRK
jgi:hypothetical protein